MADIAPRKVGEGNFSIGSAVKGGALSIKIDLNNIQESEKAISKLLRLHSKIQELKKIQEML